jgi:hypothetical protein
LDRWKNEPAAIARHPLSSPGSNRTIDGWNLLPEAGQFNLRAEYERVNRAVAAPHWEGVPWRAGEQLVVDPGADQELPRLGAPL